MQKQRICPHCQSVVMAKFRGRMELSHSIRERYKCPACGRLFFIFEPRQTAQPPAPSSPSG